MFGIHTDGKPAKSYNSRKQYSTTTKPSNSIPIISKPYLIEDSPTIK